MDKPSLRADMKHALAAVPPLQRSLEEELVNAAIMATPEWQHARTVALYHHKRIEFAVTSLANAAFRVGKRVAFPRIADMATGRLHFHETNSWEDLVPGSFGLMEPRGDLHPIYPDDLDLAIVPGLAWTREGDRLGHGGGFYDRILDHVEAPSWGVGFDCQLLDALPRELHDKPVDRVWTRRLLGLE